MQLPSTKYRLIQSTEELSEFVPDWWSLWKRDLAALPFQSPAWLVPWWRQFGNDELCSVVIKRADKVIGFLPFYVYRDTATEKRQLLPLGVGTTDYLDGVFSPQCSVEEIEGAIEVLQSGVEHDELCCSQLPGHSRLLEAMTRKSEGGNQRSASSETRVFLSQSDGCSRMPAATVAELPQKIRRNAIYYRNRAQRDGTLELVQADKSNWQEIFEELRRLHALRWQTRGEDGVLVDERVVNWHREAIPQLLEAGLLRLVALRLNEHVIAVLYSLIDSELSHRERDGRTQYFYITAYSPDHADLRPGTLLIAHAVEHAANQGVRTIDMLRGDEGYKQIWHMEKTPTWCAMQSGQGRRAEHRDRETAA